MVEAARTIRSCLCGGLSLEVSVMVVGDMLCVVCVLCVVFFFKQKTAYEIEV